jgi:hypothetical protein
MLEEINMVLSIIIKLFIINFLYNIYIVMEDKKRTIQSLIAGGTSKRFLGKEYTLEKVEKMKEEEIDKLHLQYEAIYGSLMTKDLKESMIYSFTSALNYFIPLQKEKLNESLKEDILLDNWLSTTACNIYQSFGSVLIPITTTLKVLNHINIGNERNPECTREDKGGYIGGEQWRDIEEGEKPQESNSGFEECAEEERKRDEDQISG